MWITALAHPIAAAGANGTIACVVAVFGAAVLLLLLRRTAK